MTAALQLVFAHYFGGAGRAWQPLIAALGDGFGCVAPDLPGFGGAATLPGAPSLDAYAGALAERAGDRPWIAVGHSMGGKIALAAALRRPPGLRALVLVAAAPQISQPMSDADRDAALASYGDRTAAHAQFVRIGDGSLPPVRVAACVDDQLAASRSAWEWWLVTGSRDDISADTAKLDLPVLVVAGDADVVMGDGVAPMIAAGLRRADLRVMPGGHLLPLERPAAVATAIRDFVAGHGGGQGAGTLAL